MPSLTTAISWPKMVNREVLREYGVDVVREGNVLDSIREKVYSRLSCCFIGDRESKEQAMRYELTRVFR
jgi:hypothetical protein